MELCSVIFLVLIPAILADEGNDCDATKCSKFPTTHYEELGCTPIKDANQCCVERFDCPARKTVFKITDDLATFRLGRCEFKKVIYEHRDRIPEDLVKDPCSADCYCDAGRISCTNVECPEYFRRPDSGCILQYRKDSCCATDYVCGEAEKAKLATCEFEGKTFRGGQIVYSDVEQCTSCTCEEGFNGKLDYKTCSTAVCNIEVHYSSRIDSGCSPIYFGVNGCCPSGWRCPESTDAAVTGIHKSGEDGAFECRFGNLTLARGDSLTPGTDRCTTCSCEIPPMVSCIIDPVCYERGT